MTHVPLAVRIRPTALTDIIGQDHILGPGSVLHRLTDAKAPAVSIILYAPPASGKTSIAHALSATSGINYVELSATRAKVSDVREVIDTAEKHLAETDTPTMVFIDEIHRFTKAQQDVLLPAVEAGTLRLIGATTENPSFSVNSALLSRSVLVTLNQLSTDDIVAILKRALEHPDGLPHLKLGTDISEEVLLAIAMNSSGDARQALTLLETLDAARGDQPLDIEMVRQLTPHALQRYDRDGDQHYDEISAFIKAMRGSDPDATLYWLARMIEGGEDPRYIARRIAIHASEDVGIADNSVLSTAVAAQQAVALIGMPEARLTLAHAALAVALAPKSNVAYASINRAQEIVKATGSLPVPTHLRDSHYQGAKKLHQHGVGYLYPHDYPYKVIKQQYLPDSLLNTNNAEIFVIDEPSVAQESVISQNLEAIREQAEANYNAIEES